MGSELKNFIIGKHLGSGAYRDVYEYKLDPTLVIKIAKNYWHDINFMEWAIYRELLFTDYINWVAPCIDISRGGRYLLQKKCEQIRIEELPTKVPSFFTDLHHKNWGMLDGHPVCLDYSLVILNLNMKLKKVNW